MDLQSMLNTDTCSTTCISRSPSPLPRLPPSPPLIPAPRPSTSVHSSLEEIYLSSSEEDDKEEERASENHSNRATATAERLAPPPPMSPRRKGLPPATMGTTAPSVLNSRVKKEKLYHTTVLFNSLEKTLVAIRKEAGVDQKLQQRSQKLVEEQAPNFRAKSNSTESREFGHYVHFCISLSFPPFPFTPVKAALAVARYVSLPISAKLRALSRAGEAQGNALRPHNAWAAIDTLGIAARASAPVWEGVATGFVEDPERYVLFHEIIEAAEKVNRPPISTETALAELLKVRPQLARVRSTTPPAPPTPLAAVQDPRAVAPIAGYRALTPSEKKNMRKYHFTPRRAAMPPVLYQYFMQDFNTIVMDMALHLDRDQYVDQAQQGARLADFQLRPHPRSARIRDVHVLYTHLCHVLNLQPYPITPLRLALFALAYSPHVRHVDRFDRALAARPFVQARKYPRLLRQEMVHALDDLELIQVVSQGQEEGERVSPFEMEQWGEWRMGIMQDLWGELPRVAFSAPQPPIPLRRPPAATSPPRPDHIPVFALPRDNSADPPLKRPRLSVVPSSHAAPRPSSPSPPPRSTSPTTSITSVTSSSTRQRRHKKPWYYIRAPSPHPWFTPAVKGSLPSSRRPPPLPPVLPSREVWVFGDIEGAEAGKKRSVGCHRPRRVLPEMVELECPEEESASEEDGA